MVADVAHGADCRSCYCRWRAGVVGLIDKGPCGRRGMELAARARGERAGASVAMKPSKTRAGLETAIALAAGLLGIITIFWHDWIEALTGWDPDQHNGALEWLIVAALLAVAVIVGGAARRHWRLLLADSE